MIIDKKISIITYAGSLPLNLMTKDAAISNDPVKNNQWDKMIEAIDSIYATQRPDDSLPVFWTKRFSIIDQFGNTSYKYAPHPESTLRSLDSKSAYYIIVRDSSLAPFKIPINGNLVLGYSDAEDLPYVFPPISDNVLNQESFEYTFKPRIVNLKPYESYSYSWKVVSSNWPVAVNTLSGVMKPAFSTGTINASVAFCPTTGSCSTNTLPYVIPAVCSLEDIKDPYVTLQLSIMSNTTQAESLSDEFTLKCDDCLPKPRINISSVGPDVIIEPTDDISPNPSYSFDLIFNNLDIDKSYSYIIETLRSDWPIVYVTPISGTFENKSSASIPINNKFYFCPTTGLCIPNGTTIPNYSVPNYPKFLASEAEYNTSIRAKLLIDEASCSSSDYIYSDITRITYKKT